MYKEAYAGRFSYRPTQAEIDAGNTDVQHAADERRKAESLAAEEAKKLAEAQKKAAEEALKAKQKELDLIIKADKRALRYQKMEAEGRGREVAARKALDELEAKAKKIGVQTTGAQREAAVLAAVQSYDIEANKKKRLEQMRAQSEAITREANAPTRAGTVLAGSMAAYQAQFGGEKNYQESMKTLAQATLKAAEQTANNTNSLNNARTYRDRRWHRRLICRQKFP